MTWLNYHHLLYFWTVLRSGGISAASKELGVSRPSISMQIKTLERSLGVALLERRGRHLRPTVEGKLVQAYADEIFRTGRELVDALGGRTPSRPARLRIGLADVMPKLVAARLLEPVLGADSGVVVQCTEGRPESLFADLAVHELDLVLSDIALPSGMDVRAYNHLVGESTITLFATAERARALRRDFPRSLDGAPFLMPARNTAIRAGIDAWLHEADLRPRVVGEFADSALLKVLGQAGHGVFPAPTVVRDAVRRQYGVGVIGELEQVRERYYLVSPERRIRNPPVARILEHCRSELFATGPD